MKKQFSWLALLAIMSASCCLGQTPKTEEAVAVSAKVTLADGSQLLGTPRVSSLALVTGFGKQEIPLAQIATLEFVKDGVKVGFSNKDVLSGKLEDTSFEIKTVFKEVRFGWAQIKSIQFSKQRDAAKNADEQGLLLHALLDVDNEDLSRFGASLEARNVLIVEGKNGNGMLLDSPDAKVSIKLPFSPYIMPEGTIEFWAKLPQPQRRFGGGGQPWLFNIQCLESNYISHFVFGFTDNDGCGSGGLVGAIHGLTRVGTHRAGGVSSVAETGLLGDTPDGWHHYAFVWKRDGIDDPDAKGKILLLMVDGKVVASSNKMMPPFPNEVLPDSNSNVYLVIHDSASDCTRPIAMSDLKIWDHAKRPDHVDGFQP